MTGHYNRYQTNLEIYKCTPWKPTFQYIEKPKKWISRCIWPTKLKPRWNQQFNRPVSSNEIIEIIRHSYGYKNPRSRWVHCKILQSLEKNPN